MSVWGFIVGSLLFLIAGLVRAVVADEATGRLRDLSKALVDRAALRLPVRHREEKRLEWQAELYEQLDKPLSAIRWSWRLYRSRHSMAHEVGAGRDGVDLLPLKPVPPPRLRRDLEVGDNVLYPHHGAGIVLKKEAREILGNQWEYLTVKILHNDMTVMAPCENVGVAGLRRVSDAGWIHELEVAEFVWSWPCASTSTSCRPARSRCSPPPRRSSPFLSMRQEQGRTISG